MVRQKYTSVDMSVSDFSSSDSSDVLDLQAVTALLSTEYPLIDETLIIALLSDYTTISSSHIDEVRDQLGILEASLVPDTEVAEALYDEAHSNLSERDSPKALALDGMDEDLTRMALNDPAPFDTQSGSPPSASSSSHLDVPSRSSRNSRSASVSASRTSDTTSPTSLVESEGGFEDDIALLKSLFPTIDQKTLQDALVSESGVPAAIDHLLSLELIRDVERNGHWPGEEHVDHEEEARLSARKMLEMNVSDAKTPTTPSTSRKSRSKKKGTTISLVDTLQRRNTAVSKTGSRPSSRPASRTSSPSRVPAPAGPTSNAWGAVTSLAEHLAELIPDHSASYFQSYLHHPQFHSAYAAVKAALGEISRHAKPTAHVDGPGRAVLEDIYGLSLEGGGDPNVRADLELCARTVGEDVAVVMDLMDLLGEISEWPSDDDVHRQETWDAIGRTTAVVARTPPSTPPMTSRSLPGSPRVPPSPLLPTVAALQAPPQVQRAPVNPDRLLVRPAVPQPDKPTEKIIPGSKPPPSAFSSPTAFDSFGLPSNFAAGPSKRSRSKDRQVHPKNWREVDRTRMRREKVLHPLAASIPSYARGITPHDATPGSLHRPGQSTINDCLTHAQAERLKREEAIRAAGRHYHGGHLAGGKALNGAVAGHYALQAREATERAREWELRAARMIVGDQLEKSGHTIDLHHLTIHEATTVALESTARWYDRQKATYYDGAKSDAGAKMRSFVPPRPLVVVVGVGRHSAGNVGVIGPAVATALEGGGWRVDRSGRGYLVVRGKK